MIIILSARLFKQSLKGYEYSTMQFNIIVQIELDYSNGVVMCYNKPLSVTINH